MNPSEIAEGIEKLGPWFHKIELPGGLTTKEVSYSGEPHDHPLGTWEHVLKVLPEDLSGKRVLDIGCNGGFYAIEANRRGAVVKGVEAKRWQVRQARFAARALGLENIKFERRSLYDLNPAEDGVFDVVLALGLIYHLKHIVHGLEVLFDLCGNLLILETAVQDSPDPPFEVDPVGQKRFPLKYVKNDPLMDEAAFNWFFPTAETVQAMLEDVGFSEVTIHDRFDGRAVLTARKKEVYRDSRYPAFMGSRIEVAERSISCKAGEGISLTITATNAGRGRWLSPASAEEGRGAVGLFLYLTSEDDPVFGKEYPRYSIDKDLDPGESAKWQVAIRAPGKQGTYNLEIDLVSEHVNLFQDTGNASAFVEIKVES